MKTSLGQNGPTDSYHGLYLNYHHHHHHRLSHTGFLPWYFSSSTNSAHTIKWLQASYCIIIIIIITTTIAEEQDILTYLLTHSLSHSLYGAGYSSKS
jgi:hypothetical protein